MVPCAHGGGAGRPAKSLAPRVRPSIRALISWLGASAIAAAFAGGAAASPPACQRNEVDMFRAAELVVAATVTSSRRWTEAGTTVHLVAKYRVSEVFKGNAATGEVLIATATCLDQPVPEEVLGYPAVDDYCFEGVRPYLTGVWGTTGEPVLSSPGPGFEPEPEPHVLYLAVNEWGGEERTYLEVPWASFYGDCGLGPESLSEEERRGYRRMNEYLIEQIEDPYGGG